MKKISIETVKSIAIVIMAVAIILLAVQKVQGKTENDVTYRPADESLVEKGFYPGRIYGDYTDRVFCFDAYLNHIGAEKVQRYMYETAAGTVQELRFTLGNFDYKVKTTIFRNDCYYFGLYTGLELDDGKVIYAIPTTNCGSFIMDSTSPFLMDWQIFDVLHCITNPDSELRREFQSGWEDNCPFRGLGIDHYEKWQNSEVIWHDDVGDFTLDDGLDLHY